MPMTMVTAPSFPIGPYFSTSHLPTYYPPPPCQYVMTNGVRHPLRPKPPRMGETFYSRFIPSVGQYLAFRVASTSPNAVPFLGPVGPDPPEHSHLTTMSDTSLLQTWLSKPRVQEFWGAYTPNFLENALCSKHSFPAIGMWDGVPFGYFEIYWVKEDALGRHMGGEANDWDRGLHLLVGEEWARGRVAVWSTALIHWCLAVDYRTMNVCLEPRVDNQKYTTHDSLRRVALLIVQQVRHQTDGVRLLKREDDLFPTQTVVAHPHAPGGLGRPRVIGCSAMSTIRRATSVTSKSGERQLL
jgi:N5-hydroxyornithine acetyltransferase